MVRLAVEEAVRRGASYPHAVLSWVDTDGFPVSVAGPFRAAGEEVRVGPLSGSVRPATGQEVCLTFSHIRPQPGVGYDQRRYVNLWGPATEDGDEVAIRALRASGWDEAETPFVEYAERNVGTGLAFLAERGRRPRLPAFWRFFLATRLPFLTATIVPVALGGAVAAHDGRFAWGWWLLALVSAVAAHLGINIANDLADAEGSDAVNVTPTPFSGGSRVLQYGLVSRQRLLALALAMFGVSAAIAFSSPYGASYDSRSPVRTGRASAMAGSAMSVQAGWSSRTGPTAISAKATATEAAYAPITRSRDHRTMSVRLPTASSACRSGTWFTYSTSAIRMPTGTEA